MLGQTSNKCGVWGRWNVRDSNTQGREAEFITSLHSLLGTHLGFLFSTKLRTPSFIFSPLSYKNHELVLFHWRLLTKLVVQKVQL